MKPGFRHLQGCLLQWLEIFGVSFAVVATAKSPKPYTNLANRTGGRGSEGPAIRFYPNYFDSDQLYNVLEDPLERNNLFKGRLQQDRVRELQRLLRQTVAMVPGSFAEFTDSAP